MQTFCYTRHQKKETVIDFLVLRFPYQNKKNWLDCIRSGEVRLNNKKVSPHVVLKSKDIIGYERPREKEPVIDDRYEIKYKDEYIVLVEKSGNIPISESGKYHYNTLVNILKEREGFPELYAVHRLDKETSGIVLIARTKEVATLLGKQFVNHVPRKHYHAILIGNLEEEVVVEQPIRKNRPEQGKVKIRQVVDPAGKPSKSVFTPEATCGNLTLVRVQTFTGRTHQIRCHAEHIGFPILGDKLYGQSDETFINILKGNSEPVFPPFGKIDRQLLHASSLTFVHPLTDEDVTFESDFRQAFQQYEVIKDIFN